VDVAGECEPRGTWSTYRSVPTPGMNARGNRATMGTKYIKTSASQSEQMKSTTISLSRNDFQAPIVACRTAKIAETAQTASPTG